MIKRKVAAGLFAAGVAVAPLAAMSQQQPDPASPPDQQIRAFVQSTTDDLTNHLNTIDAQIQQLSQLEMSDPAAVDEETMLELEQLFGDLQESLGEQTAIINENAEQLQRIIETIGTPE